MRFHKDKDWFSLMDQNGLKTVHGGQSRNLIHFLFGGYDEFHFQRFE